MVKYATQRKGGKIHVIDENHPYQMNGVAVSFCGLGFGTRRRDSVMEIDLHPTKQIGMCRNCKYNYLKAEHESADVRGLEENPSVV